MSYTVNKNVNSVQELREEKGRAAKEIRRYADLVNAEKRGMTAEEKECYDRVNAHYDDIAGILAAAERAEEVDNENEDDDEDLDGESDDTAEDEEDQDAEDGDRSRRRRRDEKRKIGRGNYDGREQRKQKAPTEEQRCIAFQAWMRHQVGKDLSPEHRQACQRVGLNPRAREIGFPLISSAGYKKLQRTWNSSHGSQRMNAVESRNLSEFAGPSGGYTVPETLIKNLEINMLAYGGVFESSEIMRTATGERISWPTVDDTSNKGVQLGESASIGSSVDPSFARVYWDAYKFSSQPVLVPYELIEDSVFDLASILGTMFGERLGRILADKFTFGTGAATPKGIVTAASSGQTTSSSTAITADDVIKLIHSVDPAYRDGAGFMLHDSILLAVRLLKDGFGRYIWQDGLQAGIPDRLLGYPIYVNQSMDSTIASGKKTMLFGRLSNYKVRQVGQVRMYRLEERYRDNDQDGFIAFIRQDGNLLTAGTAPVKYLTH